MEEQSSLGSNNFSSGLTKASLQTSSSNFVPASSEDTTSSTTSSDFQSAAGSVASTDNIFHVVGALQGGVGGGGPGSTSTQATEGSSAMSEDGTNASLVSSFSTSTPSIESPSKTETSSSTPLGGHGLASLLDFDQIPDPELDDDSSTVTMSLDDVLQFAQPIVSDLLY